MNAIAHSIARSRHSLRLTAGALGLVVIAFASAPAAQAAPWNDASWNGARYPAAAGRQPVQPQRVVCASCGTVEAVNQVERKGSASGAGAVAGGVLGAVLGSQMGKGSNATTATLIGAIGGGLLGHVIEKKTHKVTAYQVNVRMQDGSVRTVEQAEAVNVGTRVVFDGNTMQADAGYGQRYGASPNARFPAEQRGYRQVSTRPF